MSFNVAQFKLAALLYSLNELLYYHIKLQHHVKSLHHLKSLKKSHLIARQHKTKHC